MLATTPWGLTHPKKTGNMKANTENATYKGRLKSSYDDTISVVIDFFFLGGVNGIQVQQHQKKCVDHKDNYVEK